MKPQGVDWSKFRKVKQPPDETEPKPEMGSGDNNKGDSMGNVEQIRQEMIDGLQTKSAELVAAAKAEAVTGPVDPGQVDMIPKDEHLKLVAEARAAGYAEGLGAGVENENKRLTALVVESIVEERKTEDALVEKLKLAVPAPQPVEPQPEAPVEG